MCSATPTSSIVVCEDQEQLDKVLAALRPAAAAAARSW